MVEPTRLDDLCPLCGIDLRGDPIPERLQDEWYGGKTHYSRKIGVVNPVRDCVVEWLCPDCGGRWER